MNLDLYGECRDCDLWNALDNVNMRSYFENSSSGLDYVCAEGGSNLRFATVLNVRPLVYSGCTTPGVQCTMSGVQCTMDVQ